MSDLKKVDLVEEFKKSLLAAVEPGKPKKFEPQRDDRSGTEPQPEQQFKRFTRTL